MSAKTVHQIITSCSSSLTASSVTSKPPRLNSWFRLPRPYHIFLLQSAVISASSLPMSIIIVGVGQEDFKVDHHSVINSHYSWGDWCWWWRWPWWWRWWPWTGENDDHAVCANCEFSEHGRTGLWQLPTYIGRKVWDQDLRSFTFSSPITDRKHKHAHIHW